MWDCKYKIGEDGCRLRKAGCYPGGKRCVLYGKFEFPLRDEDDELDISKDKQKKKKMK
jgi:hypothetical protein